MRYKNSRIWQVSKEELSQIVKCAKTVKEVLTSLGYKDKSFGSNRTFYRRCLIDNIDYSHLPTGRTDWQRVTDITTVLTKNSTFNSVQLKTHLIRNGMLENKCYECNQKSEWNGKPLTLQMDHIDGNKKNQTIDNLRILCPNCHTQTKTFAGRNRAGKKCNRRSISAIEMFHKREN